MIDYKDDLNRESGFFLISGPCVVESESQCLRIADELKNISVKYNVPFIFKASYRKANRTKLDSFTGVGNKKAIKILRTVKDRFNVPITTDVHQEDEIPMISDFVDIIQIPAFLCRQTSLITQSAKTKNIVNIKKGQFMSAESMQFAVEKAQSVNEKVIATERGNSFGYHDLVVDFRNIRKMKSFGIPVVVDVTHSNQKPNSTTGVTGGSPSYISDLAFAAVVCGANGIFIETHYDPSSAKSDGANMLPLNKMDKLIDQLAQLKKSVYTIKRSQL